MKKDLDYYMGLNYKLVVLRNEEDNGYTAYYPELPGCITCADTWEELQYMVDDAKKCWLSAALEDLDEIPEPSKEKDVA